MAASSTCLRGVRWATPSPPVGSSVQWTPAQQPQGISWQATRRGTTTSIMTMTNHDHVDLKADGSDMHPLPLSGEMIQHNCVADGFHVIPTAAPSARRPRANSQSFSMSCHMIQPCKPPPPPQRVWVPPAPPVGWGLVVRVCYSTPFSWMDPTHSGGPPGRRPGSFTGSQPADDHLWRGHGQLVPGALKFHSAVSGGRESAGGAWHQPGCQASNRRLRSPDVQPLSWVKLNTSRTQTHSVTSCQLILSILSTVLHYRLY